jgi:hypothetical protein
MNKFIVKFKENTKYKPATRVVNVEVKGNYINAMQAVKQQFGNNKILILSVLDSDGTDQLLEVGKNILLGKPEDSGDKNDS